MIRGRDIVAFYKRQARLIWEWRATRLALVRRSVLTLLGSVLALEIVSLLSADLRFDGAMALATAAIFLTLLNSLARPVLLWSLSPFPILAVQIVGVLFEVLVVAGLGRFIPGVHVGSGLAPLRDALLLTVLNAFFAELLRAADDRSYFGTQVRRLAASKGRDPGATPAMLVVQIDGLSLPVVEEQMRAGRMPFLARLVRDRTLSLGPWYPLLPPVTPASQAGILHGNNDDIPGFRWYEKSTQRLMVANTPTDAAEIVSRISNGAGLLADDGASIGNLVTGDAPRSYLTMASMDEPTSKPGDPRTLRGLFVSQMNYLRLAVLTVGEVVKELYQAERQRSAGIEPRMHRNFAYALERALTNVALRNLTTALAIEEMFAGTSAIYLDYTSYDAVAHHVGPERAEAVDSLEGIDQALAILDQAARDAPRPYQLVVLSDHGQSMGNTFRQRYGELLEDAVRDIIGKTGSLRWSSESADQSGVGGMLLGEFGRGRGIPRRVLRRAAERSRQRASARALELASGRPLEQRRRLAGHETTTPSHPTATDGAGAADRDTAPAAGTRLEPELGLVGCASGNLALMYFTFTAERATLEEIDARYPGLVEALTEHPGVGFVLAHSALEGPVVMTRIGRLRLGDREPIEGNNPLAAYGPFAREALQRLDGFSNTGDLAIISPIDPVTGEVVSYEELVGSHGGLGGWQRAPFLMRPAAWEIRSEPLVGAPALFEELRRWRADLAGLPRRSEGAASTDVSGGQSRR